MIKIAGERVQLAHVAAAEDFFVGLSPSTPSGLFLDARDAGCRFIATSDNVHPRREDREFYRVTLGRRSSTQTYPQWILSDDEWASSVEWFTSEEDRAGAIANRKMAMALCVAEQKTATLLSPEKPLTLRQMCEAGAKRTDTDLTDPVYGERLDRELAMIQSKNFEDYFYIIADMISWAKTRMIVGPARAANLEIIARVLYLYLKQYPVIWK